MCNEERYRLLREKKGWRLVRCDHCGLAYLPDVPDEDAVATEYEWSRSFDRERNERKKEHPAFRFGTRVVSRLRPRREIRAFQRIRRLVPPGRLLDVGCGDGRLGAAAAAARYDVIGVELSPVMADKARHRLGADHVFCGRLRDFDFAAESFDAAVTVSYLEHEPRPMEVTRRIHELLRPGGLLINKVPNYASLLRILLREHWSGYRFPEHVQYFTPRTLARLMQEAGFVGIRWWANPLSDNFWIVGRRSGGCGS